MKKLLINVALLILQLGGDTMYMVDVYVSLIVAKRRTIEQVPTHLQSYVLTELNALGLDGNGDPIVE